MKNARLLLASYRAIPLGTTPNRSFPVRSKTKNHGVTSTLRKFEPSEPRLDLLDRGPLQTSFTVETPLSHFLSCSITLIVTGLLGAIEHEPHATAK